jgi:hypothetical protein
MYAPGVSPKTAGFALGLLAAWGIAVLCGPVPPPPPPPPPSVFFVELLDSDDEEDC